MNKFLLVKYRSVSKQCHIQTGSARISQIHLLCKYSNCGIIYTTSTFPSENYKQYEWDKYIVSLKKNTSTFRSFQALNSIFPQLVHPYNLRKQRISLVIILISKALQNALEWLFRLKRPMWEHEHSWKSNVFEIETLFQLTCWNLRMNWEHHQFRLSRISRYQFWKYFFMLQNV